MRICADTVSVFILFFVIRFEGESKSYNNYSTDFNFLSVSKADGFHHWCQCSWLGCWHSLSVLLCLPKGDFGKHRDRVWEDSRDDWEWWRVPDNDWQRWPIICPFLFIWEWRGAIGGSWRTHHHASSDQSQLQRRHWAWQSNKHVRSTLPHFVRSNPG